MAGGVECERAGKTLVEVSEYLEGLEQVIYADAKRECGIYAARLMLLSSDVSYTSGHV
jgi:hypothetical protein